MRYRVLDEWLRECLREITRDGRGNDNPRIIFEDAGREYSVTDIYIHEDGTIRVELLHQVH